MGLELRSRPIWNLLTPYIYRVRSLAHCVTNITTTQGQSVYPDIAHHISNHYINIFGSYIIFKQIMVKGQQTYNLQTFTSVFSGVCVAQYLVFCVV